MGGCIDTPGIGTPLQDGGYLSNCNKNDDGILDLGGLLNPVATTSNFLALGRWRFHCCLSLGMILLSPRRQITQRAG